MCRSTALLMAVVSAVLLGYLLLMWAMMDATRSSSGTAHISAWHVVTLLAQTLGLLPFLLLPSESASKELAELDEAAMEERLCRQSMVLVLAGVLGVGGFLAAVFWSFFDWFDPRLTALYNRTNTATPLLVPSSTPGVFYLSASAALLVALVLRWAHHVVRQQELQRLRGIRDGTVFEESS